jgi:hypothetical protein
MKWTTILIIVGIAGVFALFGYVHHNGYISGKESGNERARKDAEKAYNTELNALKNKLATLEGNYQAQIKTLTAEQNAELAGLRKNHSNEMARLKSSHSAQVVSMRQKQTETVSSIQCAHSQELERVKTESYATGEKDMRQRINETFDFNPQVKTRTKTWSEE